MCRILILVGVVVTILTAIRAGVSWFVSVVRFSQLGAKDGLRGCAGHGGGGGEGGHVR